MKNHLHSRAENVLKEAEAYENINQDKIVNGVMAETLNSVDKAYNENK